MNDAEIDRLMRLARPTPPAGLSSGGSELLEEIMSVSPKQPESTFLAMESIEVVPHQYLPGARPGRRILMVAAAVLVVVGAILAPGLLGGGHKVASPATPSAPANPYFLMKVPGWKIGQVTLYSSDSVGTIRFDGPDATRLQVFWARPSTDEQEAYQSLITTFGNPSPTTLFGEDAELFELSAKEDLRHVVVPEPGRAEKRGMVSVSGGGTDLKTFQQQVQTLVRVTPQEWYSAVRDQVVSTSNLAAAVSRVLTGVPLPEGFDSAKYTGGIPDGYDSFGDRLTGAVVCDWMDSYRKAWTAADEAGMAATEQALRTAKAWPFARQAEQAPGWTVNLPLYLAKMAAREDLADAMGNFVCPS